MTGLFYGTSGPQDAPIVLVGESWGEHEFAAKQPFVGTSGIELNRILAQAGLKRHEILCTNVAAIKPQNNDMWRLFTPKSQGPSRIRGLAPSGEVRNEVSRLYRQIAAHPRRLVISTGNYALWALSHVTGASVLRTSNDRPIPIELQTWAPSGIMDHRGSMYFCLPEPSLCTLAPSSLASVSATPLLPIIHPAAIMRAWYLRDVTVHDLQSRVPKALGSDWRPKVAPEVITNAPYQFLTSLLRAWRERVSQDGYLDLAVDVETARSFMTCLGIADSPKFAISIPFITREPDGGFGSHWSVHEEGWIIHWLRKLLLHPGVRIIGQNFIYDTQYIQHWMGFTPRLHHDTMLAQNVLFPGTPKDLGYLSSLYCDYHWYWKEDHKEWNLKGDLQTLLRYNAEDCLRTYEVATNQRALLKHLDQEAQFAFKMRTNDLCLRMMNRGIRIDTARRGRMLGDLQGALSGLYTELEKIIPQSMVNPDAKVPWYRSPKQTQFLFYDQLAMRPVRHRKTGNHTIGKEALMQLEKWYPEFTGLFHRLDLAGSVADTVDVIQTPLDPDGRMRCSFNPGGTETHRLSSSTNAFGRGTNLQNLTKGEEDE